MRNPIKAPSAASLLASEGSKKTPCCSKVGLKRGPWTPEEDDLLSSYINREGEGRWRTLPKEAGLLRCGKSCRLRWMNYLHPSVKRGQIDPDEEDLILRLHRLLGNRWSLIAGRIPGRTDNEIKNYWNTHLIKKLIRQGINPRTHKPFSDQDQPANHKPTTAKVAPSSSKQKRSQTISNPNSASSGLEEEEVNKAVQNGSDHELEEAALNYCNEDIVFSSFLNSLINDDGFSGSHLQQQSSEHELILPNPVSAFGLGWESAITSSTLGTEPKTAYDNQNNV